MITEYESNHFVKLQHCINSANKKTPEGIKFVQVVNDYFHVVSSYRMVFVKNWKKIIKLQFLNFFVRFAEFSIYFFYYFVCDHYFG